MDKTCIVAYHGTTQSYAKKILLEKHFSESTSPKEWLGTGVYFFEDRNHAIGWANMRSKKYKSPVAIVLAADLYFSKDEFFDIDIPANVLQIEKCLEDAIQNGVFSNGAPNFRSTDELRCFCANFFKETHPNIKVLAYTFDSTQKTRSGFAIKQRQLCVRDDNVIKNIRSVYTATTGKGGYYRG